MSQTDFTKTSIIGLGIFLVVHSTGSCTALA
jgi:hypothetical protein